MLIGFSGPRFFRYLTCRMLKTYSRKRRQEIKIIEDVHELCRLCLARADDAVPIFGELDNACAALPMRIMICVGHEITREDCLPNFICTKCYQELERYYKFRKRCEESYLKLKAHYNATRYRERILEVQAKNKIFDEESKDSGELQEFKIQEVEPQTDEMERLVIVDVYNFEEPSEYDKPIITVSSITESGINIEKEEETTEIQVIEQADDINPDISTFLNAILVELGILVKNDQGLVVQDQGVTSFELETGDDNHVEFELIEEDDEVESVEPPIMFTVLETDKSQETADSKSKSKSGQVRKNIAESNKSAGVWCAACGRTFASRGALRRHAAVHSGARPHACRACGRCFAQRGVMLRHALVHEATRPHRCPCCDKSYTQRGALAAHMRSHAAPPARALALHACARCDRVFLYASGLSRHMAAHRGRGFPCGACARLFSDQSSLRRHARAAHPPPPPPTPPPPAI